LPRSWRSPPVRGPQGRVRGQILSNAGGGRQEVPAQGELSRLILPPSSTTWLGTTPTFRGDHLGAGSLRYGPPWPSCPTPSAHAPSPPSTRWRRSSSGSGAATPRSTRSLPSTRPRRASPPRVLIGRYGPR